MQVILKLTQVCRKCQTRVRTQNKVNNYAEFGEAEVNTSYLTIENKYFRKHKISREFYCVFNDKTYFFKLIIVAYKTYLVLTVLTRFYTRG